jgi:hypothetical protein
VRLNAKSSSGLANCTGSLKQPLGCVVRRTAIQCASAGLPFSQNPSYLGRKNVSQTLIVAAYGPAHHSSVQ